MFDGDDGEDLDKYFGWAKRRSSEVVLKLICGRCLASS